MALHITILDFTLDHIVTKISYIKSDRHGTGMLRILVENLQKTVMPGRNYKQHRWPLLVIDCLYVGRRIGPFVVLQP